MILLLIGFLAYEETMDTVILEGAIPTEALPQDAPVLRGIGTKAAAIGALVGVGVPLGIAGSAAEVAQDPVKTGPIVDKIAA